MRVGVDHKQVEDVKVEETGEALQHEVDTKVVPAARLVAIDNSRAMSGPVRPLLKPWELKEALEFELLKSKV